MASKVRQILWKIKRLKSFGYTEAKISGINEIASINYETNVNKEQKESVFASDLHARGLLSLRICKIQVEIGQNIIIKNIFHHFSLRGSDQPWTMERTVTEGRRRPRTSMLRPRRSRGQTWISFWRRSKLRCPPCIIASIEWTKI